MSATPTKAPAKKAAAKAPAKKTAAQPEGLKARDESKGTTTSHAEAQDRQEPVLAAAEPAELDDDVRSNREKEHEQSLKDAKAAAKDDEKREVEDTALDEAYRRELAGAVRGIRQQAGGEAYDTEALEGLLDGDDLDVDAVQAEVAKLKLQPTGVQLDFARVDRAIARLQGDGPRVGEPASIPADTSTRS